MRVTAAVMEEKCGAFNIDTVELDAPQAEEVLIKIVATALSDEHVFNITGGRATKTGQPARASGGYTLNPKGQPHSALIATETVSLVIYRGEPDEIVSMELVDVEA